MTCPHCDRTDAATTERGLKRHITGCPKNPANATTTESVADRVRRRAEGRLSDAREYLKRIIDATGLPIESPITRNAQLALDSVDAYGELRELLGSADG